MIVLDTNVLSELMQAQPSKQVVRWLDAQPAARVFTTSITQAEILHGIRLLPKGKRRNALALAAEGMFDEDFAGRILAFDSSAAVRYAEIACARRRAARPVSHFDAQIAAITLSMGAELATRNVADFNGTGAELVNPWEA